MRYSATAWANGEGTIPHQTTLWKTVLEGEDNNIFSKWHPIPDIKEKHTQIQYYNNNKIYNVTLFALPNLAMLTAYIFLFQKVEPSSDTAAEEPKVSLDTT